jgi:predicted ATPase
VRTIGKLRLDGLLSFAPGSTPFELKALNVLIGPNGSGKSNLIEALELLSATPRDLAAVVRDGGGPIEWLWKGSGATKPAQIEAELDHGSPTGQSLNYRLSFAAVQSRLEIVEEAIEDLYPLFNENDVEFYYRFMDGHPVLSVKGDAGQFSMRRLRRESLRRTSRYWHSGRTRNSIRRLPGPDRDWVRSGPSGSGRSVGTFQSGSHSRRISLKIICCRTVETWLWC